MNPSATPWINTEAYSTVELLFVGAGCALWVAVYAAVVLEIRRRRYVEIPAAAVAANLAWEFVWGFVYTPDLGMLFAWMYRAGFLLDVFIVSQLWRFGSLQISTPALRKFFHPALLFGIATWTIAVIYFVRDGYDNPYGGVSGYIIQIQLSWLYIVLLLKAELRFFSYLVAWAKMLGTGLISVFNAMVYPDDGFLMTLCAVSLVLDIAYIEIFRRRRAES